MHKPKIPQNYTKKHLRLKQSSTIHQRKLKNSKEKNNDTSTDTDKSEPHTESRTVKIRDIFTSRTKEKPEKCRNIESWLMKIFNRKTNKSWLIPSGERLLRLYR